MGPKKPILEDQERNPLTYTDLIRAAFALGRKIAAMTTSGEKVAVLLPTSSAAVVTFFALHAFGRTPVMLNFTAGLRNLRAAVKLAGVKRVLTSHRFVEQGKLHDVIDALDDTCAITYLEDVRASIGLPDRLYALAASLAPKRFRVPTSPDDPGVVLFTSGSVRRPARRHPHPGQPAWPTSTRSPPTSSSTPVGCSSIRCRSSTASA